MITPLLSWWPTLGELLSARYCASEGFFRASNVLALITSFDVRFSKVTQKVSTIFNPDYTKSETA